MSLLSAVVGALASMVALQRASRALAGMATGTLVRKASHVQHVMASTAADRILSGFVVEDTQAPPAPFSR